jgi:hypothetical protein
VFGLGFYNTIAVCNARGVRDAPFNIGSYCHPRQDGTFRDPLGLEEKTFTGAEHFLPLDVEVWAVV